MLLVVGKITLADILELNSKNSKKFMFIFLNLEQVNHFFFV